MINQICLESIIQENLVHQDEIIAPTMKMTTTSDHHSFVENDLQATTGMKIENDTNDHLTSAIEKTDDIRFEKAAVSYRN